jgi:hypothetical protein
MPAVAAEEWPPQAYHPMSTTEDGAPLPSSIQVMVAHIGTAYERSKQGDPTWFIAHLKARCERSFMESMVARRVAYYVPLVSSTASNGNKQIDALQPLFSGYAFIWGNTLAHGIVTQSQHVFHWSRVVDQWRFLQDLKLLEVAIASGAASEYGQAVPGATVQIRQGHPLEGMMGHVNMVKRNQVIVQMSGITSSYALDIDVKWLQVIK